MGTDGAGLWKITPWRDSLLRRCAVTNRVDLSRALADFSAAVSRQQGALFRRAILFGSHARGTPQEQSDVDVAVVLTDMPDGLIDTTLAMTDIAFDVLLETGIDIQPVPLSEDQWNHPEHHSNPWLVEAIRREGIRL